MICFTIMNFIMTYFIVFPVCFTNNALYMYFRPITNVLCSVKKGPNVSPLCTNQFPHDKILDQTKLKAFADNKLNVTKMIISVFDRAENIVEK